MAEMRDLSTGKVYIGPEFPRKQDQSKETLDGDKEFEGTLAAVGPVFLGEHSDTAFGNVNIGTSQFGFTNFKPAVKGLALSVEGDVEIAGDPFGDNYPNAVIIQGKSFDIKHPTKEGYRLRYACVEGPEVAIYHRGRLKDSDTIELPDYWKSMVYNDSISVQITPIGRQEDIYVKSFDNEKIVLESDSDIDCFYHVYGERNDINPLIVEYEGETWEDYPDPNLKLDPSDKDRNIKDPNYDTGQNTKTVI